MKQSGLILFAFALMLSACAFNKGDGEESRDQRQMRILAAQKKDLDPIVGTWDGAINQGTSAIAIRVEISALPQATGQYDSSGNPIQNYVPSVTLLSTEVDRYHMQFVGTFYKQTGEIVVRNAPAQGAPTNNVPGDDLDTLALAYNGGDVITGRAVDRRQVTIGTLTLKRRVQQSTPGNNETEDQRINRILQAQYERVAGAYEGTVSQQFGGSTTQFRMCLSFHIYTASSTSTARPQLLVDYIRYDLADQSFVKTLDVVLNTIETPETATMTNSPDGRPMQGVLTLSISGTFTGETGDADHLKFTNFNGIHRNLNLGAAGDMKLHRVAQCKPFGADVNPPKPPRRGH